MPLAASPCDLISAAAVTAIPRRDTERRNPVTWRGQTHQLVGQNEQPHFVPIPIFCSHTFFDYLNKIGDILLFLCKSFWCYFRLR